MLPRVRGRGVGEMAPFAPTVVDGASPRDLVSALCAVATESGSGGHGTDLLGATGPTRGAGPPRPPPPPRGGKGPNSAAARAETALEALRASGVRPDEGAVAAFIDELAGAGETLAAHSLFIWLVNDRGIVPHPRLSHFVFEGLMWARHFDQAQDIVAFSRRENAPKWRERAWRLARAMRENGFRAPADRLLQNLGLSAAPRGPRCGLATAAWR